MATGPAIVRIASCVCPLAVNKKYGEQAVTKDGLIRADLLGNPWAQEWGNIYPLVAPTTSRPNIDLTALLKEKKVDELGMVRYAENFFKSLGFAPLPSTFWERSLFIKPSDHEVVCHASAWDVDNFEDLRLKMCIQIRDQDFVTVHHELGHNFYQRAYKDQPFLFKNGANDGFHEAIGDTIALSVTPEYFKQVGLLESVPQTDDTPCFYARHSTKLLSFLSASSSINGAGKCSVEKSNPPTTTRAGGNCVRAIRASFRQSRVPKPISIRAQSITFPRTRPTLVISSRGFSSSNFTAPCARTRTKPSRCTDARSMAIAPQVSDSPKCSKLGQSRPWPEALEMLTGEKRMDAGALLEYFAPLKKWLDQQNARAKAKPGWTTPDPPRKTGRKEVIEIQACHSHWTTMMGRMTRSATSLYGSSTGLSHFGVIPTRPFAFNVG